MRTIRHLAVSIAFLGISGLAWSAPVSPEQASRLALDFSASHGGRIKAPRSSDGTLSLAYTSTANTGNAYYVFNYPDNGGFVIVSADDRLSTILGYSTEGNFDPQNIPVNMKGWLDGYTKEISSYLATDPEVHISPYKKKRGGLDFPAIDPLLTTKWNQTEPYNKMCPFDNAAHSRSVTGCVATAMAQVMKYHEWPVNPTGVSGDYNFEGTTLDWRNMIDDYENNGYSELQANAVALLMLQCGRSVNMMYSAYASGAYSNDVPVAIREHFGYSASARMEFRDYFSYSTWMTMVYNELKENRPVYYSGRSERGGHAFVCDGFDGTNYFHFNWGWGGYQDGWFMLTALNPEAGGTGSFAGGYNTDQSIITGWKKSEGETEIQTLLISSGAFTWNGSGFAITDDPDGNNLIYNPLSTPASCSYGLYIENAADNSLVTTVTERSASIGSYQGFDRINASVPSSLKDGTYRVYPGYNPGNKGWEKIGVPNGMQKYVTVTVAGGKLTYDNQGPESSAYGQLVAGSPEMVDTPYSEGLKAVRYIVTNFANSDFYGTLGFIAMSHEDPDFGDTYSGSKYACIPAKSSAKVEFVIDETATIAPGEYDFYVFDDGDNDLTEPQTYEYKGNGAKAPGDVLYMEYVGPNFHTASGEGCPVSLTGVNTGTTDSETPITVTLCSNDLSTELFTVGTKFPFTARAKISLNYETDKIVEPGSYYWIVKDGNGAPLCYPSPLVVVSEEKIDEKSGLHYVIISEAGKTARIVAGNDDYTGDIVIPEKFGDYTVTEIESDAFAFSSDLKSVTIPSGVKYIQNATFYEVAPFNRLTINSAQPILAGEKAFQADKIPSIVLSMPAGSANFWGATDFWSQFLISNWTISADNDVEITGGLLTNPLTNKFYAPYYVGADEKLTINIAVPENRVCKASWELSDGTSGDTAGSTSVTLPALNGLSGTVRLESADGSGIENILDDEERADVYTPSGILLKRNADKKEIRNLPKGLYILKGKGKVVI